MRHYQRFSSAAILAATFSCMPGRLLAGPPFMTDDPDPVPLHHWEFYTFYSGGTTQTSNNLTGPAIELNNGVAPNLQLHLIIPDNVVSVNGISHQGLGDVEAGVKYRFVKETPSTPEVGIFPLLEIPTGDASRGLGNGRTWFKLPIWIQKSWRNWTADIGGGYAYNPAPGQKNYLYSGVLLQRTFSPRFTLGVEMFVQGAQTDAVPGSSTPVPGSRATYLWNVGGYYNFTPDFSLLFSAGHSLAGEGNSVFYLALYRTWGPGSP